MANASDFLIGANDEHGLNPPTLGKRTPIMPYINRSFYENEFNSFAKLDFILACLRCGFNVYDIKPEIQDVSISRRVVRTRRANVNLVVTFAYNASGSGVEFNSAQGLEVYYSPYNPFPTQSRELSEDVFNNIVKTTGVNGRFVGRLSVGMLSNVNCPSTLIEAGFMTNFSEAKLMLNPFYIRNVAEGACKGVCEFLNVNYIDFNLANYPTIRQGDRNNFVKIAQYILNEYGYNLTVDGIFGGATLNAIKNFQLNNNLSTDGVIGRNTWNSLLNINPTSFVLKRGSKASAVLFLQKLLLSYLYPITQLDGIFGRETENAVREFQSENNLVSDGIIGARTWQALVNGVGRPLPN